MICIWIFWRSKKKRTVKNNFSHKIMEKFKKDLILWFDLISCKNHLIRVWSKVLSRMKAKYWFKERKVYWGSRAIWWKDFRAAENHFSTRLLSCLKFQQIRNQSHQKGKKGTTKWYWTNLEARGISLRETVAKKNSLQVKKSPNKMCL